MSPAENNSVRFLFLVLIAIVAAAFSCSATRLRRPHKINRYSGGYSEMRNIHGLRGGISSRMYTKPTEQQWENLCKEANCEYYEWCERGSDFDIGKTPQDGLPPNEKVNTTSYWTAECGCENCSLRKQGQPKYVYAVCASNGETFLNECWFRRCQCLANRLELTIKHKGQCKGESPIETRLGDDFCPGEPKGWDDKFCCW